MVLKMKFLQKIEKGNIKEYKMIGILMGIVCVFCALTNIPGLLKENLSSITIFVFCLSCAIFNFIIGIRIRRNK